LLALIIILICLFTSLVGLIIILGSKDEGTKNQAKWFLGVPFLVAIIIFFIASIIVVPNGHAGVMVRFQKTTGVIFENGLHWKNIIDTPVNMSIKTQLFEDEATAASKDLQDVSTKIAINYKLDFKEAAVVYQTIGRDYITVIANPVVQETVKEVTSRYNAEDMILRRAEVKADITKALVARLAERGIITESVNIINFDFSEEFTKAIEAKVVAVQKVLEAENKLRQIEVEARQAEQKAKGEAAATIALAQGQAEANKILSDSLTPTLIQYMFIQTIKGTDKIIAVPNGLTLTLPTP
jgi:regulator of protease activity HflC (stomatin/prohibitin superfamily)